MDIRNCRGCGRIFNYVAGALLCQSCRDKMEVKFQEVKEYIRANPGVSMTEVSEACDVEPTQIQQWLREERLEVTEASAIYLSCEGCGANIRSGRYCDKCKATMTNGFRNVMRQSAPVQAPTPKNEKENPRMRFLQ
ncbi:MAG: flagellar protein [Acetatifactor sp.]|jgi:flagellar operon protein (TIGR03826 family)|nr:flagellar protein [Acetatifactor sp.]